MTTENKCCEKSCLKHKYHCGICNYPLTYSPQNFASRPNDIPNACPNPNCNLELHKNSPTQKWEEELHDRFGAYFPPEMQEEEIKQFISQLLASQRQEFDKMIILATENERKNCKMINEENYEVMRQELKEEILGEIERMKKEIFNQAEIGKSPTHATASNHNYGYNQALEDIKNIINRQF